VPLWRQAFETDLLGTVGMVTAALPWLKAALNHYGKTLRLDAWLRRRRSPGLDW